MWPEQEACGGQVAAQEAAKRSLAGANSVCVDACNVSLYDRQMWREVADAFGASWECLVLEIPQAECLRRVQAQHARPGLKLEPVFHV